MIRHDVPASEITTLAVGGPIATVIDVARESELLVALDSNPGARCIGGGSNLLVADSGFDGVIIRCHSDTSTGIHITDDLVRVETPVEWDDLVSTTIANGLQGIEATSGVPGSFGGAIVQNLGAYGQEIGDVVIAVHVWDTAGKEVRRFPRDECAFSYRDSLFKHDTTHRYVVTSAELRLQRNTYATPRYGDVQALLAQRLEHNGPYPLPAIRDAVLEVRRSKGMLLGASLPSAGSFFTNPTLDEAQTQHLTELGLKSYIRPDGATLTSAAALIQACGYEPGFQQGNAGLSSLHVLALVNAGNASTQEIIDLARRIRDHVYSKFGVTLTPEPVTLGFSTSPFA